MQLYWFEAGVVMDEDHDCPSLLCEELEDFDNGDNLQRSRREGGVDEEESFSQTEEGGQEREQEEDGEEEDKGTKVSDTSAKNVIETEGEEEERGKPESGPKAEEAQEVQMEDKTENDEETISDKQEEKETNGLEEKDDQKKSRKRRGKRPSERARSKRGLRDVSERAEAERKGQEVPELSSQEGSSLPEPPAGLMNSCDLSDPVYLSCGGAGLYCPPVPIPLLYNAQRQVPIQPAPPQPHGTKRPHSPPLPHTLPLPAPQPLEMEITQVYSTRRSIRYSTRGRGRTLGFPLLPGLEPVDSCLLPPAPKKKTRTLYSTDQLEHLEGLFQEDHYPDAEKRKVIAATVGVTPQRIMVWFQNRRAKWRKAERSVTGKVENRQNRTGLSSSPQQTNPPLPAQAPPTSKGAGSLPCHVVPKPPPPLRPAAPPLPTQSLPSYSTLLACITSPSQSRARDAGQNQPSSQGGLAEYQPPPMHSPPPIRRASLSLFTSNYNPANLNSNPTPPLLNTPAHIPPLFLDALEGSSSLSHRDTQSLQTDTSSLFDYGEKLEYLTSSQQNNNLPYQLQTSHPLSQTQPQTQASLPRLAYLTPSPYLTPNHRDSNPTSYLTFGPGGGSTGVVTYAAGGHTYYQSQSAGQILLQSAGHHGGLTAYQSYPWGNMYSQPAMFQRAQCPPAYSGSLGAARDHQPPSTAPMAAPPYFSQASLGPTHTHLERSSHSQAHTTTTSSNTTVLPPVSTLRPSFLRAESAAPKVTPLLPSQVSPASPESPPAPPCVKIEYDSPSEIHSHFHCDFSPIHF
ncbi:histone-lysine N-methyltransferase 2B [Myripristis murdjan]|uniref:Homeobox domain-containing protein n=1 Tax=Myripristis murdjan TaxID=586833 RepID=A0A668AVR9_9TELE|nr:homeobox protein NOBOX [Myripristis murdjan]